jgi:hypothetical protein
MCSTNRWRREHPGKEALRKTSDAVNTVMALVHPVMNDKSVTRVTVDVISLYSRDVRIRSTARRMANRQGVAIDVISLYPRDVRTLASCYRLILFSSAEETAVTFALAWMKMGGLAVELYRGQSGDDGNRRRRGSR